MIQIQQELTAEIVLFINDLSSQLFQSILHNDKSITPLSLLRIQRETVRFNTNSSTKTFPSICPLTTRCD